MGTLTLTEIKDEIRESHAGRTDVDDRLTRIVKFSSDAYCPVVVDGKSWKS